MYISLAVYYDGGHWEVDGPATEKNRVSKPIADKINNPGQYNEIMNKVRLSTRVSTCNQLPREALKMRLSGWPRLLCVIYPNKQQQEKLMRQVLHTMTFINTLVLEG